MIINSKPKRSAGFIRTSSSKKDLAPFHPKKSNSSDDDFSSFDNDRRPQEDSDREFSPFRQHEKKHSRPPLPLRDPKQSNKMTTMFSNEKLRNNYIRNESNVIESPNRGKIYNPKHKQSEGRRRKTEDIQKQLTEIGKVCQNISSKFKDASSHNKNITQGKDELEYNSRQTFRPQQSRSDFSSDFEDEQSENRNTINGPPYLDQRKARLTEDGKHKAAIIPKQYEFDESSVSDEDQGQESQFLFLDGTFKKTVEKPQQNPRFWEKRQEREERREIYDLKIEHDRARNRFITNNEREQNIDNESEREEKEEEELITEYEVHDFNKNTVKECVTYARSPKVEEDTNSRMYKTKGGVCFDLNINEFTQPAKQPEKQKPKPVKKPNKLSQKEEILKRRQMAKNYSQQARMKVFGGF